MLVLDEQRLTRNLRGEQQERTAHEINSWTMEQLGNARVIHDLDASPSNPERQAGRLYASPERLEQELRRCSENFVFEPVGGNPSKKRLSYQNPGQTHPDYICLYESGVTPEWSIMSATWRWEPDPDFALGGKLLDRADVKANPVSVQEAYELIKSLGTAGAKEELLRRRAGNHDPNFRPGFRRVLETSREAIRGWRSVVVRPLQKGYITLEQAKTIVRNLGGSDDRANWARATGKAGVSATI